jgi:hypothetical protein
MTKKNRSKTCKIKRSKRTNITRKYNGGAASTESIYDVLGNKLSNYSSNIKGYLADKGLKLLGLQQIKNDEKNINNNDSLQNIDNNVNAFGKDVVNVFDKGSAAVVENINDVLKNPKIGQSVSEAAKETAEIGTNLLHNFNENLSSPELKEEAKKALENAADYTEIVIDAMDEPINKAIDELNKAGTKALSGVSSGAIKVGTDALAAVPGVGAVIELGKIANDASKAAENVVEATSEATSTVKNFVEETSKNIDENIDKFKEIKRDGLKVNNRINESLNKFQNPLSNKTNLNINGTIGGRKTRKKNKFRKVSG